MLSKAIASAQEASAQQTPAASAEIRTVIPEPEIRVSLEVAQCKALSWSEKAVWGLLRTSDDDYTQEEIAELLGLPNSTLKRILQRLSNIGLLKWTRVGLGRPNRYYAQPLQMATIDLRIPNAKKAEALIAARRVRADRRREQAREKSFEPQMQLLHEDHTPLSPGTLDQMLRGLEDALGVCFTRVQLTELQNKYGADFIHIVQDWHVHRDVVRKKKGKRAAAFAARFIRDGERVPSDLRSSAPSPQDTSRFNWPTPDDPASDAPQLSLDDTPVPEEIHNRALALGMNPNTRPYIAFVRHALETS